MINKQLIFVLLSFLTLSVSADDNIDCSDPVTQFVNPQICNQDTSTINVIDEISCNTHTRHNYEQFALTPVNYTVDITVDTQNRSLTILDSGSAWGAVKVDYYEDFNDEYEKKNIVGNIFGEGSDFYSRTQYTIDLVNSDLRIDFSSFTKPTGNTELNMEVLKQLDWTSFMIDSGLSDFGACENITLSLY